jgi:hypothetical protein
LPPNIGVLDEQLSRRLQVSQLRDGP